MTTYLGNISWYMSQLNSRGYATGGISTGPTSGYSATLHGTEAVIPLGDGNKIKAPIIAEAPLFDIPREQDTEELRAALAELREEIEALRTSTEQVGARNIKEQTKTRKVLEKWDVDGQPETRT